MKTQKEWKINIKNRPDDSLEFIANDCYEAIQANPDNRKVYEYLILRRQCLDELSRRERIRIMRKNNLAGTTDPLAYIQHNLLDYYGKHPQLLKRRIIHSAYQIDRQLTFQFQVGWYRLYNLV